MMHATDLAARLGLKKLPRSWRGPCPSCGYSGTTFSIRAARNGRALLYCANGCTCDALNDAVQRIVGKEWQPRQSGADVDAVTKRARNQRRALRLWNGSEPIPGTPAERYLAARGLPGLAQSPALRYRADCPHPERCRLPALVAAVTDAAGAVVAVHRTFIRRDGGGKAAIEPTKASVGPIWGGAIRLNDRVADHLVIAEGIETAASAGLLLNLPAWAGISAGNMARGLILPPEARSLTIASDPDRAGRAAAREAWFRWQAEGRHVRVAVPDGGGDFNDVLMQRIREAGNG